MPRLAPVCVLLDKYERGFESLAAYHRPVQILQLRITIEPIIHRRNSRAPHQNDDSHVVKLVPERCHALAVIGHNMKAVRFSCQRRVLVIVESTYDAERKKHMATPKKNVENTMTSANSAVL